MTTTSQTTIEQIHEARVLQALADRGVASRSELSEIVGLGRSSIAEILSSLVSRGTVEVEGHQKRDGRGRPTELLRLDRNAVSAIGVDIAHGWAHVAALNVLGEQVATGGRTVDVSTSWEDRIRITDNLLSGLTLSRTQLRPLRGVAVGLFGPVDIARQWMTTDVTGAINPRARTRHGAEPWFGYVETLATRFATPVMVDNTTRFAAYAEHLAQVPGDQDHGPTLHVRCFQGVGGAIVSPSGVERGSSGLAGEIGHLTIVPEGLPCRCGRRGCLETLASTPSVLALCRDRGLDVADLDQLRATVKRRDEVALGALTRAGEAIGQALATASILIDPARIILSGDLVQIDDTALTAARAAYRERLGSRFTSVPITPGVLGQRAASLGAALTVLHHDLPELSLLEPHNG